MYFLIVAYFDVRISAGGSQYVATRLFDFSYKWTFIVLEYM